MADDKNSISLDLTASDTKLVVQALTKITDKLDVLNASVLKLQKSGGVSPVMKESAKAAEDAKDAIGKVNDGIKNTNKSSEEAKKSLGGLGGAASRTGSNFDDLASSITGMTDNLADSLTGGLRTTEQFAGAVENLTKQIETTNLSIKENQALIATTTDTNEQKQISKSVTQQKRTLKQLQDALDAVRLTQSQVTRGITQEFSSPITSIKELVQLTDEFNEKQIKGGKEVSKARSENISGIKDLIMQVDELQDAIARTSDPAVIDILSKKLALVNTKLAAFQKGMNTDDVIAYWAEQSRGSKEIYTDLKDDALAVIRLNKEYEALAETQLKATDPIAFEMIAKQMKIVQDRIDAITEGVGSNEAGRFFALLAKNSDTASKSIETLQEKVGKLDQQRRNLEKTFNNTSDPFLKEETKKKYESVSEELEKQNKLLQEQQLLKRSSIGGGAGRGTGGRNEKASAAASQVSTFISSAKAMGDALGMAQQAAQNYTYEVDAQGNVYQVQGRNIGDVLNDVSAAFENASSSFKQVTSIQQQVSGLGDNLSNWGAKIKASNQSIIEAGGQLGTLQTVLGKFAGKSEGASQGMKDLSQAIGIAGAAVTVLQFGFEAIDASMGTSSKDIDKRIQLLQQESRVTTDLNKIIREGSIEALSRQKDEIKDNIAILKEQIATEMEAANANTSFFDKLRTNFDNNLSAMTKGVLGSKTVYGATGDAVRDANKQIDALNKQLKRFSSETVTEATKRMADLNAIADKAKDALAEQKNQEEQLLQARVDAVKSQDKLASDLADVDTQLADDIEATKDERAKKETEDLAAHLDELQTLETDYNKSVFDGRRDHLKELKKNEDDFIKQSLKAQEDLNKSLAEEKVDFDKENAKSDVKFEEDKQKDYISNQKTIAKMEEDYNKEKIQRQKDLQQSLFEAELDNDALQYFKLQREGDKADREAESKHAEDQAENDKQFKEDQADKEAQRAEEKAQNEIDFRERQDEARKQAAESQAENEKQYKEELEANKKAFAEKQAEEAFQYAESRAKAVEEFKKRQKEQANSYAEEDSARQTQAEKRRAELLANYNQEIEYFRQREELLTTYINALKNTTDKFDPAKNIVASGEFKTEDEYYKVIKLIQPEIDRLENIALSKRTDAEKEELARLKSLIADGVQGSISKEDQDALTMAINNLANSAVASMQSEYNNRLKFQGDDYQAYKDATGGDPNQSTVDKLAARMKANGIADNMLLTNNGWATQDEIDAQQKREEQLRQKYGGRTLDELKNNVETQNATIEGGYNQQKDTREKGEKQLVDTLDKHFYKQQDVATQGYSGLESDQVLYYDKAGNLLSSSNQSQLDSTTTHYDAMGAATDQFGDDLETGVGDAYDKTAKSVVLASQSGTTLAAAAYSKLAIQIVNSAQSAFAKIQAMGNSLGNSFTSKSSGSSSSGKSLGAISGGSTGKAGFGGGISGIRPTFAAKGAFLDRPTSVVAGEGESPEVIFPFNKSKGIPDDILAKMGADIVGGVLNTSRSGDGLPFTKPQNSSADMMGAMISAFKGMQSGMDLSIGNVQVGSNISRDEVRKQFSEFQSALLELISKNING